MKLYQIHTIQQLSTSVEEAWQFLSNPKNLTRITPQHMGFEIRSGGDRPMFPGQIIQYTVSPFPAVKMRWVTEITHVRENEYFVDEQRFGPYALWHHKHFIRPLDAGIEMEDIVDYKLPIGALGTIAHRFFVKHKIHQIFSYRAERLSEIFGNVGDQNPSINLKSI